MYLHHLEYSKMQILQEFLIQEKRKKMNLFFFFLIIYNTHTAGPRRTHKVGQVKALMG
jgi:hypothetical protein